MTWNMDDPKWTAYVLGELDDTERAACERVLERDPEARAYVASLREAIGVIEHELAAQPPLALDELQRRRIQQAAAPPVRRRWWAASGVTAVAAAASVMLVMRTSEDAALRGRGPAGSSSMYRDQVVNGQQYEPRQEVLTKANAANVRLHHIQTLRGAYAAGSATEPPDHGTEAYARIDDNPFFQTRHDPLSTFSIDVDTASYSNIRRFLADGQRPPKDAVRIEEMINYFKYRYPEPARGEPFSISTEVGPSPWDPQHQLVRVGLQAPAIADAQVPARNLVFLIDVSGSMQAETKLPLLKQSLGLLVDTLRPQDQVSLVVYAGAAGLVLAPTSGRHKDRIRAALAKLEAGGSTNGAAGIQLAYEVAHRNLVRHGINRVILCSDGDYNVGTTSEGDLSRLIERERERGVFLTVLGFGMGNLKDSTMEKLADRGNGNYAYIDSLFEARKVLVKEAGATLVTVAKDVKLQVEFNPAAVAGYRLIGYENRVLANQDFNDDKKDAGEIGAGHAVTAIYEVVPVGVAVPSAKVDDLKYQTTPAPTVAATGGELMTVKVRYKAPDGATSKLLTHVVDAGAAQRELGRTSSDFRWAAAIAAFGMTLRESAFRGNLSWTQLAALAEGAVGDDPEGYRRQALSMITAASRLAGRP